jgi:signal peptidase I
MFQDSNTENLPDMQNIESKELLGLFEDILNGGLNLRVRVTGRSMAPCLRGGEILTIKKVSGNSLRIGDLIFFKNREGSPLLHRIIRINFNANKFLIQTKGDALLGFDEPVSENDILGKVCRIESDSNCQRKYIDMESSLWRNINYLLAVINIGKSKTYPALKRNSFYSSFRSIIKKVLA